MRFPSIQAATTFLEHNHPSIELHGSSDNGEEQSSCVRISFGRERNDRTERSEREQTEGEWKCLDVSAYSHFTRSTAKRRSVAYPITLEGWNVSNVERRGLVSPRDRLHGPS